MKKLLIVGMMVLTMPLMFSSCNKSTSTASLGVVPQVVVDEFYRMYPTAMGVHWVMKVDEDAYEATFNIRGMDIRATYTPNGNYVREYKCEKVNV